MPIVASQISLVYSGGSGNSDPKLSLGGQPSAIPITPGQLNNLFDDVLPQETEEGFTDYRCMYIFNDGAETVYNCQVWMDAEIDGGSNVALGVAQRDEVQRIIVRGTVTAGTVTFSYKSFSFTSAYDPNVNIWATNIEALMNGLLDSEGQPVLQGVNVTGQISGSNRYFDITYSGIDGGRDHDLLVVSQNNLLPNSPEVSTQMLVQGSPVNTVAPLIDVDTTPPAGVNFVSPGEVITIVKLASGEGFPLWAQRVTTQDATSLSKDGFLMKVRFESLPPDLS